MQLLAARLLKVVLIIAAIFIALGTIGIDLTAFAVFTGALGVGIGFGLQAIFNNLVAGLILLLEKSLKVGDFVDLSGPSHRNDAHAFGPHGTGSADQSQRPTSRRSIASNVSEIDISKTSNSSYIRLRKNKVPGSIVTQLRSMPCGLTAPSFSGCTRGLSEKAIVNRRAMTASLVE